MLFTYHDAVTHLETTSGGNRHGIGTVSVRRAVHNAHNQFPTMREWRYLLRPTRIVTNKPYSTGTIAYDFTGNASGERIVSIVTGTWPSWALDGDIRVDNIKYRVSKRLSDVRLQLDEKISPQADLTTGTTFEISCSRYSLPVEFLAADTPQHERLYTLGKYVDPACWLEYERLNTSPSQPLIWTIMPDPNRSGGRKVMVFNAPSSSRTVDFIMRVKLRPIVYTGLHDNETQGSVSVTSGSSTVTGTGTNFLSGMVGSIIRFSANNYSPGDESSNDPMVMEREITAVNSTTELEIDEAADQTLTSKAYRISDPIDIPAEMKNLYLRCCEYQYALMQVPEKVQLAQSNMMLAFKLACNGDRAVRESLVIGDGFRGIIRPLFLGGY